MSNLIQRGLAIVLGLCLVTLGVIIASIPGQDSVTLACDWGSSASGLVLFVLALTNRLDG